MSRTDAILKRLSGLHPKLIDLSLERLNLLLADLDYPHRRLPPVIHVAGTNGKGSTIAYLRAMLEAAGKSVHVYTSPHLVRFNERIRLAGKLVSTRRLNAVLERVEAVNAGRPITYFEVTTAAAFVLFAESKADYLLLEVGMGGTYDTTNVVDHPLGVIITPVDLDHMAFLGNTIGKIAVEKANIMKRGSPAVIARQADEGLASIQRVARQVGCYSLCRRAGFRCLCSGRASRLSGRGRIARSAAAKTHWQSPVRKCRRRYCRYPPFRPAGRRGPPSPRAWPMWFGPPACRQCRASCATCSVPVRSFGWMVGTMPMAPAP
jgi:folylpolyglutamate synthase/dihydropteroate synthase